MTLLYEKMANEFNKQSDESKKKQKKGQNPSLNESRGIKVQYETQWPEFRAPLSKFYKQKEKEGKRRCVRCQVLTPVLHACMYGWCTVVKKVVYLTSITTGMGYGRS